MATPHSKTETVGAGGDESIDEEVWIAFDAIIEASRPQSDPNVRTMQELMKHYGQSRNLVRKWLAPAMECGKIEKVVTYRQASDGIMKAVPGYKVKDEDKWPS